MRRSYAGAAIILIGAAIILLFGLQSLPKVSDKTVGGMTAILGTIAYISAKHRRLYPVKFPWLRKLLEIALVIGVCVPRIPWTLCLLASGRPDLAGWTIHSETTIMIPVVTVTAYVWVTTTKNVQPAVW